MKIKNLFLSLFTCLYFANASYAQAGMIEICGPETYMNSESALLESDFDLPNCDIKDSYSYFTFGVGPVIFIPNVGIGYRERSNQFGWDTALSFSTIGYAHQLSAHVVGHYYLNPSLQNSAYVGLGLMGSGVLTNHAGGGGTISPDFVFGKEFQRKDDSRHFLEMHVGIPTFCFGARHHDVVYLPLMYIKYGISF